MMNLETRLTFAMCLLVLVISLVPVQSASSVEKEPETSVDRIKRRSYYNPWSVAERGNSVSFYEASNTFRAAPYRVPRPYYIPVYGAPGRPLIYYPPQPIYVNPGMPQDNPPMQSFGGSMYLPPKESPHFPTGGDTYLPPKETPPKVKPGEGVLTRDGTDDDDDDDAPIWMDGNTGFVQMQLSGDPERDLNPRPTRPPNMGRPTSPPLIHNPPSSGQSNAQASQSRPVAPQQQIRPTRPTQPPPTTQRSTLRTTTVPPTVAAGPSNCVWAIISCCSASNPTALPQNCFEQRGCPGPFWGASPCESDYARAAIAAAVKYYNTNPRN